MLYEYEDEILNMVCGGYMTTEEIVDVLLDSDEQKKLNRETVVELVQNKMNERIAELNSQGWSAYDRLHSTFERLERRGILARENYWCCETCAYAAIDDEIAERTQQGETVRGYVLFHSQDTERAVESGELTLRYGGVTENPDCDGPAVTKKIGDEIVMFLHSAGFKTRWSGSPDDIISLPICWDKRPGVNTTNVSHKP